MPRHNKTIDEVKHLDRARITEIAELTGTRYSTIKFYTELGLLPFEQKGKRLARYYPVKETSQRVKDILKMRGRGQTIAEIINHYIK